MINFRNPLKTGLTQLSEPGARGMHSRAASAHTLLHSHHILFGTICLGDLNVLSEQDSWTNGAGKKAGETHEQDAHESYPSCLFESVLLQRDCWMQSQKLMHFVLAVAATLQTGFDFVLLFFSKRGQNDQVIYYTHYQNTYSFSGAQL